MDSEKAKTIERVQKLMRLASDASSPNEAVIAARRARSLMDRHGLCLEDLQEGDGFGEALVGEGVRMQGYKQNLAIAVADWNDCIARRRGGKILFLGLETDCLVAASIFVYLVNSVEALSKHYLARFGGQGIHSRTLSTSFKMGASIEIRNRINQIIQERAREFMTPTGTDLVLAKKALVESHFKFKGYGETKARPGDDHAFTSGSAAAKEINLNTQISGEKQTRSKLPEGVTTVRNAATGETKRYQENDA